ncbi:uncharacterized protein [Dysidea avara]|uniref:uncharacterized protein n=1 Tax=Dysidea avara TaxID=196820 RepID=UPI00332F9A3F
MHHSALHLALLIASTLAFAITVIINGILNSDRASSFGVEDSIGQVGKDNPVDILPAGWTFSIWIVIYTWQGAWILYAWTFVFSCRPTAIVPINKAVHALFVISCALNIIWLYLFGNEKFTAAFVLLLLLEFTLDAMIGVATYTSYHQARELIDNGQKYDVVLTQVLLNNGIGVYETWVTIAAQVNLAVVLQHVSDTSSSTAAIVALSIILTEMLTWFIAEITFLDRFVRYTLTVYPVAIWALAGIISNNWDKDEASSVLTLVAICIAGCLLVIRFVLAVIYHFARPWNSISSVILMRNTPTPTEGSRMD